MSDPRSGSSRPVGRGDPRDPVRGRVRPRAPGVTVPGGPPSGPPPPDPTPLERVVELRDYRGRPHGGRRVERRDPRRRSRGEREEDVLELLGTYRVISRRGLVEFAFDGHPFAASRTLAGLERRGLLACSLVPRGRRGYQVFSLTPAGRDLIAERRRRRRREEDDERAADDQRFWSGFGDVRQLAHDHRVFEAVMQDSEKLRAEGGRIRRVRLEPELRALLSSAGETARVAAGPDAARAARCREARRIGLAVFERDVPLPDALIEVEDARGRVVVRGIEVVSGSYTRAQVRAKRLAGFRLYSVPGFRRQERQRRIGTLDRDKFPLSWGGGR